jgi:hypothetical protein
MVLKQELESLWAATLTAAAAQMTVCCECSPAFFVYFLSLSHVSVCCLCFTLFITLHRYLFLSVYKSRYFKLIMFILAAELGLQVREANEGEAALKHVSGAALGGGFDGVDDDSDEQVDEGFDDEEEEEDREGALGSPMKKDAAGRTPRRNSIEFLQVTS